MDYGVYKDGYCICGTYGYGEDGWFSNDVIEYLDANRSRGI